MHFIDVSYIRQIGYNFENFKEVSNENFKLKCPYCGDSKSDNRKARGGFIRGQTDMVFTCFKCKESKPFGVFLKENFPDVYKEYLFDKFGYENKPNIAFNNPKPVDKNQISDIENISNFSTLIKINVLKENHPAKEYLKKRKIPFIHWRKFKWCVNYRDWAYKHCNTEIYDTSGRLCVELVTKSMIEFGLQGRSLNKDSKVRYISSIFDDRFTKQFGMQYVNLNDTVFVLEGVYDSMFFPNAIASLDSQLHRTAKKLNLCKSKTVLVFDNEKRNSHIIRYMNDAIDEGYNIALWPSSIQEKDVNDCVLSGNKNIVDILSNNVYSGLRAKLEITKWMSV